MAEFHIIWRPSSGRGEFEYSPIDVAFEEKTIELCFNIQGVDYTIPTDTFLLKIDGKRRLRRENPNDRKHLSIPALVAATMAIPQPTRESHNIANPSLTEGKWALGPLRVKIESTPVEPVLRIRPLCLMPRHFSESIDIVARLNTLEDEATAANSLAEIIKTHFELVKTGTNTVALRDSARKVFEEFRSKNGDIPLLATPEEIDEARLLSLVGDNGLLPTGASEGKKKLVAHTLRERNKSLVKKKKAAFIAQHGQLFCECCNLSPIDMYGFELDGIIEAHHRVPLADCADDEVRITSLDDLVLLCRNCHGAIHRVDPLPSLQWLSDKLQMRPQSINAESVS